MARRTGIGSQKDITFGIICLFLTLSACGGGSGGGAGSVTSLAVTQPHHLALSQRPDLPNGSHFRSEYQRVSALPQLSANVAYEDKITGLSVKVGVVDTGIDSSHPELATTRLGRDWHSSQLEPVDPEGHGTHVAALLGAKRDGIGMHGIAPQAALTSYRIFDAHGSFGGLTGGAILPSLVSHAQTQDITLLNNGWASSYEITDLSKSAVGASLGAELSAWQSAVGQGMVMVWAAGNNGDDQVSIRAGLPAYYHDLRKGWLAVVSVDSNGKEPRYTNRCGVASSWCITAPGGGDYVFRDGLYAAKSGGGYERRSGTSMAAPLVTGSLALILDAFPQLSPQQAAQRILQTASYDGLVTADGCTLSKCGEETMRAVFGQGMLQLDKALSPIGTLSLTAGDIPLSELVIETGVILDEALLSAMTGVTFTSEDSHDGAHFEVPASAFLVSSSQGDAPFAKGIEAPLIAFRTGEDTPSLYVTQHGHFPASQLGGWYLQDLSQRPMAQWLGLATDHGARRYGAHFGYDHDRLSYLLHTQHQAHGVSWALTMGGDETKNRLLDTKLSEAFGVARAQSQWFSLGARWPLGQSQDSKTAMQAEWLTGRSYSLTEADCQLCQFEAQMTSWRVAAELVSTPAGQLSIALSQPLYAQSLSFHLPASSQTSVTHHPSRPPRHLSTRWDYPLSYGTASWQHHFQATGRHIDQMMQLSWRLPF